MIQNLKNFKVDKVIRKTNKYFCIGRDLERPAILELSELQNKDIDTKDIFTRDHLILGNNDIYFTGQIDVKMNFISEYKCPVTVEEIQKIGLLYSYRTESYEEYLTKKVNSGDLDKIRTESYEEYLTKKVNSGDLDKIIEHTTINNLKSGDISMISEHINFKLLYNGAEFLIIEDLNFNSSDVLRIKLIYKDSKFFTIRDVSDPNILLRAKEEMIKIFSQRGIPEKFVCLYIDLMPREKRFHINGTDISKQISISFEGGVVLIDNCIKNLNMCSNYYRLNHGFIDTQY